MKYDVSNIADNLSVIECDYKDEYILLGCLSDLNFHFPGLPLALNSPSIISDVILFHRSVTIFRQL